MAQTGIAGLTLMERAAAHVADAAMPYLWHGAKLLVLAGTGNNGGDGLAAARILLTRLETLRCVVYPACGNAVVRNGGADGSGWSRLPDRVDVSGGR